MRRLVLALTLLVTAPALAQPIPPNAGIAQLTVQASPKFDVLVWYPTEADGVPWQTGPFLIPATHDAPIGAAKYPVVLLSLGGNGAASPLLLSDLSTALVRSGFVVVAPFHGNLAPAMLLRPRQVFLALGTVMTDARFKGHLDAGKIGMIGFSLGGAVALSLAGAVPNGAHFAAYCDSHWDDIASCGDTPGGGGSAAADAASRQAIAVDTTSRLPLKALMLLDPFAAIYDHDGLAAITMPVSLYRPEASALGESGNALALQADLRRPPAYQTIPGGHYIFLDVCPPAVQAQNPAICEDPPDINRAGVHARIAPQIAQFFRQALGGPTPP